MHANILSKYGKENIIIRILASELSEIAAFWLERSAIILLHWAGCKLSNMTLGGEGVKGYKYTEEQLKKWRARRHPPEVIAKMRCSAKNIAPEKRAARTVALIARNIGNQYALGYNPNAEQRSAISARLKGNKHLLGHKHSAETKMRLSANSKALWADPQFRRNMMTSRKLGYLT